MGFLTPWFLAGVAAVGLPVWLHLLRKHKTTPLPFSSLMFFEKRTQSSIKHRRLRYLVLFALRALLMLLIVLAFAHPYVRADDSARARAPTKSPCWRSTIRSACAPAPAWRQAKQRPNRVVGELARRANAPRCWRSDRACRC